MEEDSPQFNSSKVMNMEEGLNDNAKMIDTMGSKIKDTVALVCVGDSRGFVHMNHLILK